MTKKKQRAAEPIAETTIAEPEDNAEDKAEEAAMHDPVIDKVAEEKAKKRERTPKQLESLAKAQLTRAERLRKLKEMKTEEEFLKEQQEKARRKQEEEEKARKMIEIYEQKKRCRIAGGNVGFRRHYR